MISKGKLILVPSVIAQETQHKVIPLQVKNELKDVQHFLAENIRTARRFLSSLEIYESIEPLDFKILNKETRREELPDLFQPIFNGQNIGVLSESGCPGVADPGALAVNYAQEHEITIVPLVGPSSILLALMSSGLNGQQFAFRGYLPIEPKDREKAIREFEKESLQKNQTQIFIETPYRNFALFSSLLKNLKANTKLCVAVDLTGQNESIRTMNVREWQAKSIDLPKLPAIFLFHAG
ncbi:MAG TPA: SAM-dependent methyltransferase [Cyclobacteriaceae bacterium]|nr:SAM-dependent methyltransferase [Cyclobacteriaceae bacterium]